MFADALGVFRLAGEAFPETATLLKPDTAALFWQNLTAGRRQLRTAGYAVRVRDPQGAVAEIGHTGFTGTAVFLCRQRSEAVVILANRVHPDVRPVDMARFRRRLLSGVRRELGCG